MIINRMRIWGVVLALVAIACTAVMHVQAAPPPPPPIEGKNVAHVSDLLVSANADVMTANFIPPADKNAKFYLTIGLVTTDSVVNVMITAPSGTEYPWQLSSGALTAGRLYSYEFNGASGNTYNVQCETLTTVGELSIRSEE